jgi:hypothetical protein
MVKIPNLLQWWRDLPQKTRIRLIACIFLVLAGPEVVILAAPILEVAAMVDLLGLAFFATAILASVQVWYLQLRGMGNLLRDWLKAGGGGLCSAVKEAKRRLKGPFLFYSIFLERYLRRAQFVCGALAIGLSASRLFYVGFVAIHRLAL